MLKIYWGRKGWGQNVQKVYTITATKNKKFWGRKSWGPIYYIPSLCVLIFVYHCVIFVLSGKTELTNFWYPILKATVFHQSFRFTAPQNKQYSNFSNLSEKE